MPTNTSRRSFLKTSAGAAAIAAVSPTIIPRNVLAQDGTPGANDRINVGYIAIGRRAQQLLGLPKEGKIVAFADVYLPRAEQFAAKYEAKAFQDYRKLLDMDEVDAVVTATPDHWRAITSIHAAQAGKDIYAEKPMNLTIVEGRRMVDACKKFGTVLQTGSQQRSMPINRYGCELVRNERIGKLQKVIACNYPSPWNVDYEGQPVPEGLDWDMWCGPTEPVPYHKDIFTPRANPGWISFRPYSGGEVTGWGAHGIDQIQWALGMDGTGPVELWTEGEPYDPPTYTEPTGRGPGEAACKSPIVKWRYANGIECELGNGPGGGGIFVGEDATLTIDRSRIKCDKPEIAQQPIGDDDIHLYESNNHMQNWFDCMKSREKCIADVEIGHSSTTLCHLINIARWVGGSLKWDPKAEQFTNSDAANALLDRERRAGFELPEV